jgi:hypothetical protein
MTVPDCPEVAFKDMPKAPKTLMYDGVEYKRIGDEHFKYVSQYHKDKHGYTKRARLYYDASRDILLEYTYDGIITFDDTMQKRFHGKLFKEHTFRHNEVYNYGDLKYRKIRYVALAITMIYMRMNFFGIKPKIYYRAGYEIFRFKNADDYSQFRLYFNDYFMS